MRAYGDAVREVLAELPRAMRVPTHTVAVEMPYPLFERVRLLVEMFHGQILEQDFGAEVTLTARFADEGLTAFEGALRELSSGTVQARLVRSDEATIVPIGELGTSTSDALDGG